MSSIPRGPKHDDAAEPPPAGANLPRPNLDQTLVGVAPTVLVTAPVTSADKAPEAAQPIVADKPQAIVATPTIAVSGDASKPKLDEPAQPGGVNVPRGPGRANADPALQSTALASDYLQAARDAALRKASVPRPRRPTAPAQDEPSPATLHASVGPPAREPTTTAASGSPMAAPSQSVGTQASIAPPLEAAETEEGASAPAPLPLSVAAPTPRAHGSAPAHPPVSGFEPVPTVRAPLWEQAPPSVGRPLTLDNGGAPDWKPFHAASSLHGADTGQRSRWYGLRWVALAAAALAAVAVAVFGEQLTGTPEGRVNRAETATKSSANTETLSAAPPEQTLLANRPASEPAMAPSIADLPATTTSPASHESPPGPVIAPARTASAEPTSKAVAASKGKKTSVKRAKAKRKRAPAPASEKAPASEPAHASEPAPPSAERK